MIGTGVKRRVTKTVSPQRRFSASLRDKISHFLDSAVAGRINPRDTLIVSGFWRSGTTWVQQVAARLLRAKTVFEPLHFLVPAVHDVYRDSQIGAKPDPVLELFMPYCGERTLDAGALKDLFQRSLQGDLPGSAVRLLRTGVGESMRRRVVLKLMRAHLCMRAAQNTFSMPIVHVVRDPRAVVASIRMTNWAWLFDHLSLREQLIEPADGRAAFFRQWQDDILRYDRSSTTARIAAYWALTERFLATSCAGGDARFVFASYEELCESPESVLLSTLERLGLEPVSSQKLDFIREDSRTTSDSRRGASVEERLSGWSKTLSRSEISTIETITSRFGFEDRLVADG
jgi:hypothetical protein